MRGSFMHPNDSISARGLGGSFRALFAFGRAGWKNGFVVAMLLGASVFSGCEASVGSDTEQQVKYRQETVDVVDVGWTVGAGVLLTVFFPQVAASAGATSLWDWLWLEPVRRWVAEAVIDGSVRRRALLHGAAGRAALSWTKYKKFFDELQDTAKLGTKDQVDAVARRFLPPRVLQASLNRVGLLARLNNQDFIRLMQLFGVVGADVRQGSHELDFERVLQFLRSHRFTLNEIAQITGAAYALDDGAGGNDQPPGRALGGSDCESALNEMIQNALNGSNVRVVGQAIEITVRSIAFKLTWDAATGSVLATMYNYGTMGHRSPEFRGAVQSNGCHFSPGTYVVKLTDIVNRVQALLRSGGG